MATPVLERRSLPGALGEIQIDIRGAPSLLPRPAVVIQQEINGFKDGRMSAALAERLARAGFTAISFGPDGLSPELSDLESAIAALDRGELGVPRPTSLGLVGHGRGGGIAILASGRTPRISALVTWAARNAGGAPDIHAAAARVTAPWLELYVTDDATVGSRPELDRVFDETTAWLSRHLK